MKVQPKINIEIVGHVDHGKTTLLKSLTGKWSDTHSEEVKRGITIRLGYADAELYKCRKEGYTAKKCPDCKLLRAISFVDAPGHESLMATMLSGAALIDGAILLVAANEPCPQPQTKEHLMALEIVGIKNIIIIQNKIDSVTKEDALKNYEEIKKFVKGTVAENAPVIPVSAKFNVNISYIIEAIEKYIPNPERDLKKDPVVFIARSFDVNKPGAEIKTIVGGVLGGALKQGILKKGEKVIIIPGIKGEEKHKEVWKPIETTIIGLKSSGNDFDELRPGGSLGILTSLDPSLTKADALAGNMLGLPNKLPPLVDKITLEVKLLDKVIGVKDDMPVDPIKIREVLMINVNSSISAGFVEKVDKNVITISLKRPVCGEEGCRVAISRRIGTRFRLIGCGYIKNKK